MCLEVLQAHQNQWLPAWFFVGEREGVNGLVFLSYKAPARLSDLFNDRTDIVREQVTGPSGATYYKYKLLKS